MANEANEQLLDQEFQEIDEAYDDDDAPTTYGSVLNWTSSEQLGGLGLLYVILSLLLVNGHSMSDRESFMYSGWYFSDISFVKPN